MAFFKFRKGSAPSQSAAPAAAVDLTALRVRARNRLLGAGLLVLLAGTVLGLAFDREPRRAPLDARVLVAEAKAPVGLAARPSAGPVQPMATAPAPSEMLISAPASASAATSTTSATTSPQVPSAAGAAAGTLAQALKPPQSAASSAADSPLLTELKQPTTHVQSAQAAPENIANKKPNAKSIASAQAASSTPHAARPESAQRALALLQGQEPSPALKDLASAPAAQNSALAPAPHASASAPADAARRVVQVGAFTDAARVKQVRAKLERAGLKTYAQAVDTATGRRIRVRLGPYASRAEADKAAARVKKLGLPAAVLTL